MDVHSVPSVRVRLRGQPGQLSVALFEAAVMETISPASPTLPSWWDFSDEGELLACP